MKTSVSKKISSLVLALAVMFTTVFAAGVPVQAAAVKGIEKKDVSVKGEVGYLVNETGNASAGVAVTHSFDLPASAAGNVGFIIGVRQLVGFQITITQSGQMVTSAQISTTDESWTTEDGLYYSILSMEDVAAGSYDVSLTFDSATEYGFAVLVDTAEPKLNQTKATITVGFTKKLSVSDGKVSSWSSKNKKVATVDKNGKVTAKKAGKAVIVAKCTDGTELRCNVTVKANQYTARKITTSDVSYGDTAMSAYKVSFDKKGNLVIKARYVNRMSYKVSELRNIKITVKDANGKTVGTYKQSKKKVSVSSGSTKDFTFTIKKSSLKKKKADLRGGEVSIDGTSYYYVYY